jgi:arylsulfatase A-like enzyme
MGTMRTAVLCAGFAAVLWLSAQSEQAIPSLASRVNDVVAGGPDKTADQGPYNILFVICDQESYHIRANEDFVLPARMALQKRGVTFRNHYIGSVVCTPSRALFFTGESPQVNGVYDHLAFGFVPSLSTEKPNMGKILKGMGYHTAYFGKYELSTKVLAAKRRRGVRRHVTFGLCKAESVRSAMNR